MIDTNKTINFFTHAYLPQTGGIERYTANFASEMVKLGYKVNIITTNSHNLERVSLDHGKLIYRFSAIKFLGGRFPIPFNILQISKVYKHLFKGQNTITVLNSRLFLTSIVGLFLGKLSRSQIILIEHGSSHIEYSNPLLTKIFATYEHFVTKIFKMANIEFYGVSEASNLWLKHFKIEASGVINNGVNISKKDLAKVKIDRSKKVITFIGRLIKEKGIMELIESFEEFSKNHSNYQLIIVGEGELQNEILKKTLSNKAIKYMGKLNHEEVLGLLSQTDLFVNPSNYGEGLPTTLLEAGYFGIPTISTPNGGAKEVIKIDKTGILIEKGEVNLILTALNYFENNKDEYAKLGLNLADLIEEKYIWKSIAKDFIEKLNNRVGSRLYFTLDLR